MNHMTWAQLEWYTHITYAHSAPIIITGVVLITIALTSHIYQLRHPHR